MYRLKVFTGKSNVQLAEAIARFLGVGLVKAEVDIHSDGETKVKINENIRGMDVFIVQPTCPPVNQSLMELLIMIDAAKRSSADRITAVMPYYGYARQDQKVAPRTPITAKLVADLLTAAGADRILAMDLHAGQIQGFFNIPVDNLYCSKVLLPYLAGDCADDIVMVAPHAGEAERARAYAKRLKGAPMAIIDKRDDGPDNVNIIGEVAGKRAIVVSDMIDTAKTMTQAAEALIKKGATEVIACATHAVLSGEAVEKIARSAIKKVIVTDTIPLSQAAKACGKIKALSVDMILADAILRIYRNESVSSLFT